MSAWASKTAARASKMIEKLITLLIKNKTLEVKKRRKSKQTRNGTVAGYARSALDTCMHITQCRLLPKPGCWETNLGHMSLKTYIQCAARISRHRAISQFALISFFSWLQESCFLSAKWSIFRSFLRPERSFLRFGHSFLRPGGLYGRFLGWLCDFIEKCAFADAPPRCPWTCFLRSREVFFFECSCFWIFVILSAQKLHCGSHFDSFLGALGLFKNSWKCVSVVNFRGLTPFGRSLLPGLDCECVLRLIFYLLFRC